MLDFSESICAGSLILIVRNFLIRSGVLKNAQLEIFDITWVDKFPDKPWDFQIWILVNRKVVERVNIVVYQLKLD